MNKVIVTTTINHPTEATLKFCEIADKKDWIFLIVGDKKTRHEEYQELVDRYKNVRYLTPEMQEENYPELSNMIGWNTIQRRNIGFVHAYNHFKADIMATVDDDNIPYDFWGDDLLVGKTVEIDHYQSLNSEAFDPLSVTTYPELWHRGFPIEDVPYKNEVRYLGKKPIKVLVQADFWDGDPDIDAICRLSKMPIVKFDKFEPFASEQYSPFNSQNTFLAREVIPKYAVLPFVGRMDDIWGGYILQHFFPHSIAYCRASVYQERNPQDLVTNLENEVIGYRENYEFLRMLHRYGDNLPVATREFYTQYQNEFK